MNETKFFIKHDNVQLFCRRTGSGAPLLLIHGACVDSSFFADTAACLSSDFTVYSYDRRGSGQSLVPDSLTASDYTVKIQAEDAAAILRQIGPCHIAAHSAGSDIALELAAFYPELVRSIFLYEPPLMKGLHCSEAYKKQLEEVTFYLEKGRFARTICSFYILLGLQDQQRGKVSEEELLYAEKNTDTFFHREYYHFMYYSPSLQKIKKIPVRIGAGELSVQSFHKELAETLDTELISFPGRHNCPRDLPVEFAGLLTEILDKI